MRVQIPGVVALAATVIGLSCASGGGDGGAGGDVGSTLGTVGAVDPTIVDAVRRSHLIFDGTLVDQGLTPS